MIKIFILLFFTVIVSYAKECSPYYNPNKFYETPELLAEFIQEHSADDKLFPGTKQLEKLKFKQKNNSFVRKNSFIQQGDYIYPIKTTLWKYTIKSNSADEINISRSELYRFQDEEIANSINDDFDNYWSDFIENGYSMQLTPEQTLFRYNQQYFTFSVYIYGVIGDATPLKGTVVNFWFKNYTNEVNEFIQCEKDKNGSR